ncbi:TPA: DNA primase [Staphylococcus aureus]|uniref:DNA primase n=1 Tax=Staphylococcus TaxID=1279 RepID=UPI0001B3AD89|nr:MULTISPECIES: DNA primase [Staphylococcus]HDH6293930.1 DNA primase [Staphylococcus aureus LTCF-1-17]HDK8974461.1 DNA primase [Staphylococcus aureus USA600-NRS22]HDK9078432.1 DNA primase [Staphylococcus aureus USA600-BAA1754]HDK9081143.1 DNA primase [Staphylococcus aureus USA600-BAA1751]HDQ3542753.1 DNA primase [Staphylococcus aureus USA600-NY-315]
MRIDQSIINEIKDKTDILDLVSEYVKLEKRGRNYIGLCPFHDEKTPSFTVSEDKQICHCFGCKKGGNVFQFTQEIKDISFVEAVKELGDRVNVAVDIEATQSNSNVQIASDDLQMIEMHELIQEFYYYALTKTVEGEKALTYLLERGFTDALIKERGIGFAPDSSHFCHDFLQKKGYDIELAYEAGLLSRNEENFSYYDRFRNRIMFPLKNAQGRIVGYSGRTYTGQEPKYLNSPETPIFQKRKLLYNLDKARKSIRKLDEIVLLEGFMDVIKSDTAGLKNVVATMGTQLSDEHITFIRKLTSNITLMFDGDFAGSEATLKTGQHLLQQGLNVFVIQLPSGMDPDEYIGKYGNDAFTAFVKNDKKSFAHYKVSILKDEIAHNDLSYERYLKELSHDISFMKSSILQQKAINDVAPFFNVSPEQLANEIQFNQAPANYYPEDEYGGYIEPEPIGMAQFDNLSRQEKAERAFLKHLMRDKDTFLNYYESVDKDNFTNQHFKYVFEVLHDFYAENDQYNISDAVQYVNSNELRETLISLEQYSLNDEPYENEIDDYVNVINENGQETIESLNHKLREATRIGDVELQKYYLQQIVAKNKERM